MNKEKSFLDRLYLRKHELTKKVNDYATGDRVYQEGSSDADVDRWVDQTLKHELIWIEQTIDLYIDSLKPSTT